MQRITAAALAGGVVAAGPALAAKPGVDTRWNGRTTQPKGQIGFIVTVQRQAVLTLGTFRWRCHGRTAVRAFQPSATAGPVKGLKIRGDGRFGGTASGIIINDRRKRIGRARVGWSGRFTSARKAGGTVRFRGAGCSSPVLRWTAKLTRQR